MAKVSTVDDGEIDYEEMPDLHNDNPEGTLELEVFKLDFLSSSDYSRETHWHGPFKEEPTEDCLQLVLPSSPTMHYYPHLRC